MERAQASSRVRRMLRVEFYNQPKEIILKAISVLEKQGKAQLIDMGDGDFSVKFL